MRFEQSSSVSINRGMEISVFCFSRIELYAVVTHIYNVIKMPLENITAPQHHLICRYGQ